MDEPMENKGSDDLLSQYKQMTGQDQGMDEHIKQQTEGLSKDLTPMNAPQSPTQSDPQSGQPSGPQSGQPSGPQSAPQSGPQSGPQSEQSTRDRQKQVNRVDNQGEQVEPRLAQKSRVPSQAKPAPAKAAESAAKHAAKILAPTLGSGLAGGLITYFIT